MVKFSITPNGHMVEAAAEWTDPSDPKQVGTDKEVSALREVLDRFHPQWREAEALTLPATLGRLTILEGDDGLTYTTPLHSEADAKHGPCRAFLALPVAAGLCVALSQHQTT